MKAYRLSHVWATDTLVPIDPSYHLSLTNLQINFFDSDPL